MMFHNQKAEVFIPDGVETASALERTTHLAVAAHQDDIEIMSYDGILQCFGKQDRWFTGAVVTNGSGSPRDGLYAAYTDEQMQEVRIKEQKKAAYVGEYAAQILLQHSSSDVKDVTKSYVVEDIMQIIRLTKPDIIYTHNLADKHNTHVAVALRTIQALRKLPREYHPQKLYGCEVWRDLDWLADSEKVVFDISRHENIASALMGVFDSQISGGKRYDLAMMGRRRAHATFASAYSTDTGTALSYAMDLTPLINDVTLDIEAFLKERVDSFLRDITGRVKELEFNHLPL